MKFWMENKKNKAFTLIELLVVIAIIGIISSVVLASISRARTRAQDAAKNEEARQIITALELYYQANGGYPVQDGTNATELKCLGFSHTENCLNGARNGNVALNDAIKEFMPGLKANRSPVPGNLTGITYRCETNALIDNKCPQYVLMWYLATPDGRCLGNTIQEILGSVGIPSCTYSK